MGHRARDRLHSTVGCIQLVDRYAHRESLHEEDVERFSQDVGRTVPSGSSRAPEPPGQLSRVASEYDDVPDRQEMREVAHDQARRR